MIEHQEDESEDKIQSIFNVLFSVSLLAYGIPVLISIASQFFKLVIKGDTNLSIFMRDFKGICIDPVHNWYIGAFELLVGLMKRLMS
jgi:hypothetical protein